MIDQKSRDQQTIKELDAALNKALDEIQQLHKNENHRIMCLQAEVRARAAAAEVIQQEKDILEEGLNEAKRQIAALQQALRVAEAELAADALEIRHGAEADPADSGVLA